MSLLLSNSLGSAIPDSGVSRWTFDDADTSGTTAIDVWGDNDGTISGATTGVSGANQTYTTNEAYSFDGTDDYVDIPDGTEWEFGTGGFSYGAWFKTAVDHRGRIITESEDGGNLAWNIRTRDHDSDGAYELEAELRDSNGNNTSLQTSTTVTDGSWYHAVVTVDVGAQEAHLYLDATEEDSTTSAGWTGNFDSPTGPNIGYDSDSGSGNPFEGDIDDPRVYDKMLSAAEISDWYNDGTIL